MQAVQSAFQHTGFIAQVAKDGICDVFRKMTGQRPSVHKTKPDVRINIRLDRDRCLVSLDTVESAFAEVSTFSG